ncbi:MAG: Uma2 family endonuclease [Actinomycetota bacterium]
MTLVRDKVARSREIEYPTSDGKPMAESDLHRDLGIYVIEALKAHFAARPEVYVSGNNFVYWEEGNPRAVISPDAYVVLGVGMRPRDCYMAWKEGGELPDVVFEFTSRKTRREDTDKKRPLYELTLRVPEYFLFDPTGDYLKPRFHGYRLEEGRYVPLEIVDGRVHSEVLGLDLVQQGERLRLFDPASSEWLLSPSELLEARSQERLRAETERGRAEAERARAEAERARAEAAEADAARLRAELAALRASAAERE